MLHTAAMLLGFFVIWLVATQRASTPEDLLIAAGASVFCVLVAMRAGGIGAAFASAPRAVWITISRAGAVLLGGLATIRAALAADVTLKPALVRVKTRGRGAERAAFAGLLSATPGMAVVETDTEGFLVHVMNEDAIDAAELGRLERVTGAQNEGALR